MEGMEAPDVTIMWSSAAVNDITVERRFNLQNLHLTEADRVPCSLCSAEIKTFPDPE